MSAVVTEPRVPSRFAELWRDFRRNRGAVIGLAVVVALLLCALLADAIAPYPPNEQYAGAVLKPPSLAAVDGRVFVLGTDPVGRDIASRLIHGTRLSLAIGAVSVGLSLSGGIVLGLLAGFFRGAVEFTVMRLMDIMLALPSLLLAVAVVAILGPGLMNAMDAIAIVMLPHFVRLTRAAVIGEMGKDYVAASRLAGAGPLRLMFDTVLPNCAAPLIVQTTLGFSSAILDAAALGFLGLGAQPPTPEWGSMLASALEFIQSAWWVVTLPGLAILVSVLAFNLMGDGLRDALDPRLKGEAPRSSSASRPRRYVASEAAILKNPKNVNVLGLLSANVGLGITARIFAKVLASHSYEVHGLDVEGDGQALKVDGMTVVRSAAELPSGVNLMVLSFDRVAPLLLRRAPELLGARFRNVGLLFWELAVIPPAWKPGMALFDGLVACSRFNQQSFEMACPDVPVTYCEHPVEKTAPLEPARLLETRRRYGIADRQFLASASFDLRSGIDRKNPFAVIETFKRAFPDDADVRLLLKAHGYEVLADRDSTRALIEAVRHDSRIVLETGSLPYIDVRALYAASDVYLSLHRSEGLGLGLMESMAEGTLVIATGYSGNVSFMTEQNSMLVPYRLVKPDSAVMATYLPSFAGRDSRWAAVDVDVAARMLRRARDDRLLRETLAARARDDIAQRQQTAWEAEALRDALRQAAAQPFDSAASARRIRRARLNEFTHPTLFERNVRHAVRKLR